MCYLTVFIFRTVQYQLSIEYACSWQEMSAI